MPTRATSAPPPHLEQLWGAAHMVRREARREKEKKEEEKTRPPRSGCPTPVAETTRSKKT
jgi:hypothetical protein